jgi:phosphatidate cytidylyltransferase
MFTDGSRPVIVLVFLALTVYSFVKRTFKIHFAYDGYIHYLWVFFTIFTVAEVISFNVAIWILAFLCFMALREYFSMVDVRLQDRWGILGAYLSIPFMIILIQYDSYGVFIISIPVYSFLVIPFLVTLGGKEIEGTLFSIGLIDFGLFLLVYCIGHIGYLARFATWWAIMLVLSVTVCDVIATFIKKRMEFRLRRVVLQYVVSVPVTCALIEALSPWTRIPWLHGLSLGALIPALVAIGRHTIRFVEKDLGITSEKLLPGKGQVLDNLRSFLYTAPVVFHYLRYFSLRSYAF